MQKNIANEHTVYHEGFLEDHSTPSQTVIEQFPVKKHVFTEKIDIIRENIIGFNTRYISPFNIELESVYIDHTATNRPYRSVEDIIRYTKQFAANPHTEFSHFGSMPI